MLEAYSFGITKDRGIKKGKTRERQMRPSFINEIMLTTCAQGDAPARISVIRPRDFAACVLQLLPPNPLFSLSLSLFVGGKARRLRRSNAIAAFARASTNFGDPTWGIDALATNRSYEN